MSNDTLRAAIEMANGWRDKRVAESKAKGKPPGIREDDPDILFYHEALPHAKEGWLNYVKVKFCESIGVEYIYHTMRGLRVPDGFTPPKSYREWFMTVSWD